MVDSYQFDDELRRVAGYLGRNAASAVVVDVDASLSQGYITREEAYSYAKRLGNVLEAVGKEDPVALTRLSHQLEERLAGVPEGSARLQVIAQTLSETLNTTPSLSGLAERARSFADDTQRFLSNERTLSTAERLGVNLNNFSGSERVAMEGLVGRLESIIEGRDAPFRSTPGPSDMSLAERGAIKRLVEGYPPQQQAAALEEVGRFIQDDAGVLFNEQNRAQLARKITEVTGSGPEVATALAKGAEGYVEITQSVGAGSAERMATWLNAEVAAGRLSAEQANQYVQTVSDGIKAAKEAVGNDPAKVAAFTRELQSNIALFGSGSPSATGLVEGVTHELSALLRGLDAGGGNARIAELATTLDDQALRIRLDHYGYKGEIPATPESRQAVEGALTRLDNAIGLAKTEPRAGGMLHSSVQAALKDAATPEALAEVGEKTKSLVNDVVSAAGATNGAARGAALEEYTQRNGHKISDQIKPTSTAMEVTKGVSEAAGHADDVVRAGEEVAAEVVEHGSMGKALRAAARVGASGLKSTALLAGAGAALGLTLNRAEASELTDTYDQLAKNCPQLNDPKLKAQYTALLKEHIASGGNPSIAAQTVHDASIDLRVQNLMAEHNVPAEVAEKLRPSTMLSLVGATVSPESAQRQVANQRAAATMEDYMNSLPSEVPPDASPELARMVALKNRVMTADAAMTQAASNTIGGVANERIALEGAQAAFAAYYEEQKGNLPMTPYMQAKAAAEAVHKGNASIAPDAAEAQHVARTGEEAAAARS